MYYFVDFDLYDEHGELPHYRIHIVRIFRRVLVTPVLLLLADPLLYLSVFQPYSEFLS